METFKVKLLTLILIVISYSAVCHGQWNIKDTSYFDGCNWTTCKNGICMTTALACSTSLPPDDIYLEDTLIADRVIEDSIGRTYQIEYRYVNHIGFGKDEHAHYISLVNIIQFKGNKQHTIASNIKAIYSPVECIADNRELWLKRLYEYQNK